MQGCTTRENSFSKLKGMAHRNWWALLFLHAFRFAHALFIHRHIGRQLNVDKVSYKSANAVRWKVVVVVKTTFR
jgi:hypothetical protein